MKNKYRAIFVALLISYRVFADSKVEDLKNFYDNEQYEEAAEIIREITQPTIEQTDESQEKYDGEDDNRQNDYIYSNEQNEENIKQEGTEEEQEEKLFAFFYDGLISFKKNNFEEAEKSFNHIIELKKNWEQIDEVYFWLGKISFAQKKYSQGIDFLNLINKDKISSNEIDNLIQYFFSLDVDDIELNRCVCKRPDNNFIVKKWIYRQSQLSFADQYIWLIQDFFNKKKYHNYRKYFFNKVKINKKDQYNVAILLKLNLEEEPKKSHSYDFYNLFSMALEDSPNKDKFQFYFYDIKSNEEDLNEVLNLNELKNMDVLINVSKKNLAKVSSFSSDNGILLYDFSSKNLNSIQGNYFAFLTKASKETASLGTAKFILDKIKEENNVEKEEKDEKQEDNISEVTVISGKSDYKIAEIFKNYLTYNGVAVNDISLTREELRNLLYNVRVNLNTIKKEKLKKEARERKKIEELKKLQEENEEMGLATTAEIQNDIEEEENLTEKLDIIKTLEKSKYVFLASNDIFLLSNVIGITEQCKIDLKIFCDYELLNSDLAEEIFNKENIFYFTSNKYSFEDNDFIRFKEKYFNLYKKYPSLEMFHDYNAMMKILNDIARQKVSLMHDEQELFFINF